MISAQPPEGPTLLQGTSVKELVEEENCAPELGRNQRKGEKKKSSTTPSPPLCVKKKNGTLGKGRRTQEINAHLSDRVVKQTPPSPRKLISAQTIESPAGNLPRNLVGPSPIVLLQVEGIYTQAFLDTGAQVTLLYLDYLIGT